MINFTREEVAQIRQWADQIGYAFNAPNLANAAKSLQLLQAEVARHQSIIEKCDAVLASLAEQPKSDPQAE